MARLDAELISRKLATSRERAKELIKDGYIAVNGSTVVKPSAETDESDVIISTAEDFRYVGRGGYKLEFALNEYSIDLRNKICMDIGASTGGFTDCMLGLGAEKVYAVDVGHGQLAEKLRKDYRVVNMEKTDVRNISGVSVDFVSADVSFISLTKILDKVYEVLKPNGTAVVLIKPQFEVGKKHIGKNGIVKDEKARKSAVETVISHAEMLGFKTGGPVKSPITGGSGNIEFLLQLTK